MAAAAVEEGAVVGAEIDKNGLQCPVHVHMLLSKMKNPARLADWLFCMQQVLNQAKWQM